MHVIGAPIFDINCLLCYSLLILTISSLFPYMSPESKNLLCFICVARFAGYPVVSKCICFRASIVPTYMFDILIIEIDIEKEQ